MSYTQTTAVGRFVADPEIKPYGTEGKVLARFRIAVNLDKENSAFYNCVAFAGTASVVQRFCQKGKQVLVEGVFKNNDYDKDVNGTPVRMYGMELTVNRLVLLGDATGGGGQGPRNPQQQQQQQYQQQAPAAQGFGGFNQTQAAPAAPASPFSGFGTIGEDDLPFN